MNGIPFYAQVLENVPAGELKPMADALKIKLKSAVITLIATSEDGKGSVVVAVTDDLTKRVNAVDLAKAAAVAMGGSGGGGRADMAQAGGPDGGKASEAVESITKLIAA